MKSDKTKVFQRVEKHIIKENHKLYEQLDEYCFLSKNLYNYGNYHIRQIFIICSKLSKGEEISEQDQQLLNEVNLKVDSFNELRKNNFEKARTKAEETKKEFKKKLKLINYFGKDNKYLGYEFLDYLISNGVDYKSLMAQTSQQTLKLLDKNWISFFEAVKKWSKNKESFSGRPKIPNYRKKNGRNIVVFTNQNCKQVGNYIQFPKIFNQYKLETSIKGSLRQVRILPRNRHFIIEIVYTIPTVEKLEDNNRYLGIDIGIDNLATVGNNVGEIPIIINGKSLKSINQYYNKEMSHYRETAKRMNDLEYTRRMSNITIKRNNKIDDFLHKASKHVVEYALSLECNTIIIGNNKDWKRESKLSKKVNQSFVGLPHQRFIEMIQYKAENLGINVVLTEESYTSGTSFIDGELPVKGNYNKSRRKFRGLFISNKGIKINADLNGSYQIIKKVIPNAFADGIEGVGLHPVRVNIV